MSSNPSFSLRASSKYASRIAQSFSFCLGKNMSMNAIVQPNTLINRKFAATNAYVSSSLLVTEKPYDIQFYRCSLVGQIWLCNDLALLCSRTSSSIFFFWISLRVLCFLTNDTSSSQWIAETCTNRHWLANNDGWVKAFGFNLFNKCLIKAM